MKKIVVALALVLLASFAGWYFTSPGYAMMQLRDAALAGDAEALEQRVDFPAIRAELKEDLRVQVQDEIGSGSDLGDQLGSALGMVVVDQLVDELVSPKAMAELIEQGEVANAVPGGAGDDAEQAPEWVIEREGLSRFTARPQNRETLSVAPDAPGLVFERDGMGWRLVELQLPER